MDKAKVAAAISRGAGRTLIFSRTKRGADKLVRQLGAEGVNAGAIHGDLRQSMREKSLATFSDAACPCSWPPTWPLVASMSTTSTS